ncbi:MAG: class I SAM-dependent methyltransferase, partial [Elusimicrobiota bacterium]|nr:class I SAM-dependent methyltransferase [Elusimicrobiota bacterium]
APQFERWMKTDDYPKILVDKIHLNPDYRILDIGCGNGYFLKLAKDAGLDVSGVEINPYCIKFAKEKFGISVDKKTLKEFKTEEFDVITLFEVLDQFRSPIEELLEINRLLKKDGLLVIRVNNALWHCNLERFRNFFAIFGLYPSVMHLYSFTAKTLYKILIQAGFKDISITNSKFTEGDPYKTCGIFGKEFVMLAKYAVYGFSQIMYFLFSSKLCLAPAIIAFARK